MFAEPMTLVVAGQNKSLQRTGTGMDKGAFASSDQAYKVSIAHDYKRRTRRVIKLTYDSLVANPLVAGQNINQSVSVHLVVDTPAGYDASTAKTIVDALTAYLTASSGAQVSKLLGGES